MGKAYKYRGGIGLFDDKGKSIFHRDIDTLADNKIYLPTISQLNDPTEGFFDDSQIKHFVAQWQTNVGPTSLHHCFWSLSNNIGNCVGHHF